MVVGAASDTYDVTGRVLARADTAGVTREKVEEALNGFTGDIMQIPPIYSALRVQGKRLYEYAREGKMPPVEIESRPIRVERAEVTEWFEPGAHGYELPREEAEEIEKIMAEKFMAIGGSAQEKETVGAKRKRDDGSEGDKVDQKQEPPVKKVEVTGSDDAGESAEAGSVTDTVVPAANSLGSQPSSLPKASYEEKIAVEAEETPAPQNGSLDSGLGDKVPAAKISITSSSGFYVRSLCHDLGKAVGSLGVMASLIRTRQGGFELGRNVFEYEDINKGEEVWGPKIEAMLAEWTAQQKAPEESMPDTASDH